MKRIIAEIGINHFGDFSKLKKMISESKKSGCWAVKFQYRGSDFFAENDEMGSTLIREELEKSNLQEQWINEINDYCRTLGIQVGYSFFRQSDLDYFFDNYTCDFVKIPSAEFRNIELIEKAKRHSNMVMVSYGGGEEKEIFEYIELAKLRSSDIAFHCISNYPVAIGNEQLSFINRMSGQLNCGIGYSSHDEFWETNIIAMINGADYIERHVCLSKDDEGLDITTSSDFAEINRLHQYATNLESILSEVPRVPNQGEILNVRNLGSGLYAKENYVAGQYLNLSHFVEKSPRIGVSSEIFLSKSEFLLKEDIKQGNALLKSHLMIDKFDKKKYSKFLNQHKISIPVRLHDISAMIDNFESKNFELHLSYKEIYKLMDKGTNELMSNFKKGFNISIHLPDYISKDKLIDPFSTNQETAHVSKKIIDFCFEISKNIMELTKNECRILGSFSVNCETDKESYFRQLKVYLLDQIETFGHCILLQWLPKMAWYFGGSVKLNLFCDPEDVELVEKYSIPICLDIAHLILSANYHEVNWIEWYNRLLPFAKHIHLSDAVGIDGEGVEFGTGDIKGLNRMLDLDMIKVLEVWEGHLNNGEKFKSAIKYLETLE